MIATIASPAEPAYDDIYRAMHDTNPGLPHEQLRALADWIQLHGVTTEELVAAEARGYDLKIHLNEIAARRLFPGREVLLDHEGHCYFRQDGILFVFIADSVRTARAVTL